MAKQRSIGAMEPWTLAARRLKTNAVYQWKALRTVLDWTVWLYIVIPLLLLGLKFYYNWWTDPLPASWIAGPYILYLLPCILPVIMGMVHTWSEGGDILFLRQKSTWWKRLVLFGFLGYTIRSVLFTGFVLLIVSPWLFRGYGLPIAILLSFGLSVSVLSVLTALLRNRVHVTFGGWRRWGMSCIVGLLSVGAFGFSLYLLQLHYLLQLSWAAILAVSAIPLLLWRLNARHTFDRDVELEGEMKLRLTALLLSRSVDKPTRSKRKRPLLFPKSGYFMKRKHGGQQIGAIAVKSLLRSRAHLLFYIQLTMVGLGASFAASRFGLFLIVVPVLYIILSYWLSMYWREFIEGDVPAMFSFRSEQLHKAAQHMVKVLCAVPGALWAFAGGIAATAPLISIGWAAAGGLAAAYIGGIVIMMTGWKEKRKQAESEPADDKPGQ
ncbi:ABC transporter permease [Paenibacillus apiarius]|uniref:ABC transporter permease n=1 Tax=Paenibacillus apiarius TaxID=46240 RepID=UPI00197D49E1|nr:ABC transporter permease [Paenibacillus apiarius]MBN3524753.1 ABC transporter permease [Paenibacillus apiarius]